MMMEKQIQYLHKILNSEDSNIDKIAMDGKNQWCQQIKQIIQKHNLNMVEVQTMKKDKQNNVSTRK